MLNCLKACLECCFPGKKRMPKYPQIHYQSPEDVGTSTSVSIHGQQGIPLQHSYEFQQPRREIHMHPQLTVHVMSDKPREQQAGPSSEYLESVSCDSWEGMPPTLQFSLYYNIQSRSMTLHLQQAYNLSVQGRSTTCDPFVVMFLLPNREEIFESKVVFQCSSPIFDQMFEFTGFMPSDIRRQTLIFRVCDHAQVKDKVIGAAAVQLEEADLYGVTQKVRLDERQQHLPVDASGDLLISLRYKEQTAILQGILLKATNLQHHVITGSADPFVKINLLHKGKRHDKWKSTIKKNTTVPIFNEAFLFSVSSLDIDSITLEVFVLNHDRFAKDEVIGMTCIGSTVVNELGRLHWDEVILSPNQPVSRWHTLVSPRDPTTHVEEKDHS